MFFPQLKNTVEKMHSESWFRCVFFDLRVPDVLRCSIVCKAWARACQDVVLLNRVFSNTFGLSVEAGHYSVWVRRCKLQYFKTKVEALITAVNRIEDGVVLNLSSFFVYGNNRKRWFNMLANCKRYFVNSRELDESMSLEYLGTISNPFA